MVILKMKEDDKKCPFVTSDGCTIYDDRPWSCRMYPLDMEDDGTFHFITDPSRCKGFKEDEQWRIGEWLLEQGVVPYDQMNNLFTQITLPLQAQEDELDINNPTIVKMTFMAIYNIDKFRDFVFNSSFLDRFEVEQSRIERIKRDDIELLKFGFDWIKFGIFGQILFHVKDSAKKEKKN
jgi:hypothetical protein